MKRLSRWVVVMIALSPLMAKADLLFENSDFEKGTLQNWTAEGDALIVQPTKGDNSALRNRESANLQGDFYIGTFEKYDGKTGRPGQRRGDKATGTLTSVPFTIKKKFITFRLGGGAITGEVGVSLLHDGKETILGTGFASETMKQVCFDATKFVGKKVQLVIFDKAVAGWGHVNADDFRAADQPQGRLLSPMVKPDIKLKDEWSTFPLYSSVGYDQHLRPQFHFTSRMGWLNDPNGMVYYDGEWHMLFQHYAKGNGSGTKSWGNAVSNDLMHWQQLPHAINPYRNVMWKDGSPHAIWSGSGVVDVNNALGKQKGDVKTLYAIYSATHRGPEKAAFFQGAAFSTDKGRTWTKINDGKPMIEHQHDGTGGQRDPRIFYYAPGKYYVVIMMVGGKERAVRLWKSTDLMNWEVMGDIPNKAAECIDMYTVPLDGDKHNMKWVIADAGTRYEVGDFDGKQWKGSGQKDENGNPLKFDFGDSYYAAQAFNQGPVGRVVHVGWLRSKAVGYRPFIDAGMPFTQQMSVPAEITLRTTKDGIRMYRYPVKEIEKLYAKTTSLETLPAKAMNTQLATIRPELVDLTISFAPKGDVALNVRGLIIHYDDTKKEFNFTNTARVQGEKTGVLTLPKDRQRPYRDNGLRNIPAPTVEGKVKLRVLVDRASLELFANDGQAAASFVVVPDASNRTIAIEGNDALTIDSLVVNELKSAWGTPPQAVPLAPPAPKVAPKPVKPAPPTTTTMPSKHTGKKPNVIVVFVDDMGYGDIGPFGSAHKTPHLDRMAAEGMKLTDFYVSSSACTPSRAALMTGCYANRIGMGASVVFPADKRGLNPSEITIAEILKKGGYATGCFGKWHLGDHPSFMPNSQGFDVYEGIPYSNDMWGTTKKRKYPPLPWIKQNKAVAHIPDNASQAVLTDAITDATVEFIKSHKDKPFFAYVPYSAVHGPHITTEKRLAAVDGDVMTALISEIDDSMGRIMKTVKELGITDNTIVLFTNDNGGAGKTSSGPLRGAKFGPKYEGHMRVSTLAWWPGKIPAGSVSSEIMTTIDVLPTIAKLAGQPVPSDRIIDGKDVSDILLGKPDAKSPHETLYYENDGIRQGKWKLVSYRVKADRFNELYDLDADLGERNNIADKHPDRVKAMKALLEAHTDSINNNLRPAAFVENPKPLLTDAKGLPTLVEYINKSEPRRREAGFTN